MSADERTIIICDLIGKDKIDEAIKQLYQLQRDEGVTAETCYLLGDCYLRKGWLAEAERAVSSGRSLVEDSEIALKNRMDRLLTKIIVQRRGPAQHDRSP